MVAPLDVFAVTNGKPNWLGWADTLAMALQMALKHGEGSYFVLSQETGQKNFYKVTADGRFFPRETCMRQQ